MLAGLWAKVFKLIFPKQPSHASGEAVTCPRFKYVDLLFKPWQEDRCNQAACVNLTAYKIHIVILRLISQGAISFGMFPLLQIFRI